VLSGWTEATLSWAATAIADRASPHTADVSRAPDVLALRGALLSRHSRIDVPVNNAGNTRSWHSGQLQQPRGNVDRQCQDDRVEQKAQQPMHGREAAELARGDLHIGYLECHAEHQ
jgi:NAD(P)-dependent dehydrogenase (short-subunit alcohol dehydrogenase family)